MFMKRGKGDERCEENLPEICELALELRSFSMLASLLGSLLDSFNFSRPDLSEFEND